MDRKMFELTYPQKNIWLVEKYNGNTPINSIVGTIEIKDKFDENICKEAINYVIKSNDAMRFNIKEENESVFQYVTEFKENEFTVMDLSGYSSKKIDELKLKLAKEPLDILNNKLFEFYILRYSKNSGAILMKIHHIISDAWSCSKIGTSIIEYIESKLNKTEFVTEIKPSYVEYIKSEKEYESSDKFIKDEKFWQEYLVDVKEPLSIKDVTSSISKKASRYSVKLTKKQNIQINEYCKENRISPYALFLAALSTYLYRIKDSNDFIIGTPVLNRSNFKEKNMVGMFVSTMPLRVKIEENQNFIDLARNISSNTLTLFRHQKYPYSKTLEYIHKNTDIKTNLYNVVLSYQNARADVVDEKIYSTSWVFNEFLDEQLQIHIMDMDNTGTLNINYDYLVDIFTKEEIKYLHTRIMAIIQNAISDIQVDIENIRIMSIEEENKILYEFNDTDVEYPKDKTVIDLFEEQVEKTPDNIGLVFEDKEMTYRELNEKANQFAHYLREEKCIRENDVIAITIDKSLELIISIIAVLKLGACYVPIEKKLPLERKEYILKNAQCKITIDSINYNSIDKYDCKNIQIQGVNYSNCVYIMYTSGTTGKPKGVIVNNRNIIRLVKNNRFICVKDEDVIAQTGSIAFDASTFEFWGALLNGAKLCLIKNDDILNLNQFEKIIKKNNVTIMWLTAPLFNQIVDLNKKVFDNLKYVLTGGDVLSIKHINKLLNYNKNINIINGYGPTENTTFSTAFKIDKKYTKSIPIGSPISNSKCYILDKKLRLLPIFITGQLVVGGDGVANGYINNEELTLNKFIRTNYCTGNCYKTGDFGYYDKKGILNFCGREDNQVKIHGFRVELDEIKNKILDLKEIEQCYIFVDNTTNVKNLIAFCKCKDNLINGAIIKERLKEKIPHYMIPKKIICLDEIPLNHNGKVDFKMLMKETTKEANTTKYGHSKKVTNTEKKLILIYQNILNTNVSCEDNFFEVGGDSLSAIKLAMNIEKEFSKKVNFSDVLKNQTISEMANFIDNTKLEESILIEQNQYPLSRSQLGILSSSLLNKESINYNIPIELTINDVNVEKYKKAMEKVIKSNYSIFNRIFLKNGKYYQKVFFDENYEINFEKVSFDNYQEIVDNFVKKFNIVEDYLFRINMYLVDNKKIKFLMDFHHLIFDGISFVNLINEFCNVLNGENLNVNKLEIGQFAFNEKDNSKENKFFVEKFSGDIIKMDISDLNEEKHENAIYNYEVDIGSLNKIKKNNQFKKLTDGNILLAIFSILISKYCYSNDVILGTAYSGRKDYRTNDMLGMFVKNLPIRFTIDSNITFLEYCKYVQNEMQQYIANSEFSFEDLAKKLKIQRDKTSNPLYDIMFIYQSIGINDKKISNAGISFKEHNNVTPKMDLIFNVFPFNEKLKITVEYDKGKISQQRVERLCYYFKKTLQIIENSLDISINKIDIVEDSDFDKIKYYDEFKHTKTSVADLFNKICHKNKDKVAVVSNNNKMTYQELYIKSNIIANYLIDSGIKKNDKVAVSIKRDINLPATIFGILKAGACYVPIDKEYPIERKKMILKNGNIKEIFVNVYDSYDFEIDELNKLEVESIFDNYYKDSEPSLDIKEDDLAYIIFTSGTTGNPKAVTIKQESVLNYIEFANRYFLYNKVISVTTISFDIFVFELFTSLCSGSILYIANEIQQKSPTELVNLICENEIDTIMTTPSRMKLLLSVFDDDKLITLKNLCLGGEIFPNKLLDQIKKKLPNARIYNCYGPTETTVYSTFCDLTNREDISVGNPINNTKILILDKSLLPSPLNSIGQIAIGGLGVSAGYLNNVELNNKNFIEYKKERLYLTGDLGYWGKDGTLHCLGRIDNQIKIRGYRVELDEINQTLEKYEMIDKCATICKNIRNKNVIISYYTSNYDFEHKQLINHLKKVLPAYMIPSYFYRIDKMPITPNGKIDKKYLEKLEVELKSEEKNEEFSKIELELLSVFKEVLKVDNISKYDNFFEIGGDSLLAMELAIAATRKNIIIEYSDIFNYPTIDSLGKFLSTGIKKYRFKDKVEKIDFSNINGILNNQTFKVNKSSTRLNKVLLFGSTGFLGAHILYEILEDNKNSIVYCVVRGNDIENSINRLKDRIVYYFGYNYFEKNKNRIVIINDNIENKSLLSEYLDDIKTVDLVINAAALVKHFGNFDEFYDINLKGTNNIISLCEKINKKLIHISTTSVSGDFLNRGQEGLPQIDYSEKNLFVEQNLENNYVYTKFMAEYNVLKAVFENKIDALIMRMGNLMGRKSDGKFQYNFSENAFMMRVKAMLEFGCVPENLLDKYVEFTPIDSAAKAILSISKVNVKANVFHINNVKYIKVKELLNYMNLMGFNINVVNKDKFSDIVKEFSNNNIEKEYIYEIVTDIGKNNELNYDSNIKVNSEITVNLLRKIGFEWDEIDYNYIMNLFTTLKDFGYLEGK